MNARFREGLNISQAAAGGLKIYRYVPSADGESHSLKLVRELKPATLERRFRTLSRRENDQFDEMTEPFRQERVGLIGISAPRPSLSFTADRSFHRGRPRKYRRY